MITSYVYVCTYYDKTVTNDHYNDGADPSSTRQVSVLGQLNIEAPTLSGLLKAIGNRLDIAVDGVCIYDDLDLASETSVRVGYNRMENEEGNEPSARETDEWKEGRCVLYLADYDFVITYRTERAVTREEFDAAGVANY